MSDYLLVYDEDGALMDTPDGYEIEPGNDSTVFFTAGPQLVSRIELRRARSGEERDG